MFTIISITLLLTVGFVGFSAYRAERDRALEAIETGDIPMDILEGLSSGKKWHALEGGNSYGTDDGWTIVYTENIYKLTFLDPEDQVEETMTRRYGGHPQSNALRQIFETASAQVEERRILEKREAAALASAQRREQDQKAAERHERMRRTLVENVQNGELSIASELGGELSMDPQPDDTKPEP